MQNDPVVILCADADNVGGHLRGIRRRSGGAVGSSLKTDKEEYTADEDIALTLEIRNGSTGRLVDIAYDITAPDGYELKSGSASGGETELLAGGTLKYRQRVFCGKS